MELRRQIRDEKDEVERREGMLERDQNDDERDETTATAGAAGGKDTESIAADSPMPDTDNPSGPAHGEGTDLLHASIINRLRGASAAATPEPSTAASIKDDGERDEGELDEDTNMSDEGEIHTNSASPHTDDGGFTKGEMDTS